MTDHPGGGYRPTRGPSSRLTRSLSDAASDAFFSGDRPGHGPRSLTAHDPAVGGPPLSLVPGAVEILAARRRSRSAIPAGNVLYVMGDSE